MTLEQIKKIGLEQLAQIQGDDRWRDWLTDYLFRENYPDDGYAWLTCVLALKGKNSGNYGVGDILVDDNGNVVASGHNEVFHPHFRSDRHAEMVVMDNFEEAYPDIVQLKGYTLYTSVECCPMCLTRLISSGVNRVLYVAPDEAGGMVHRLNNLPPPWVELAKRQAYGRADCSPELVTAATEIFLLNRAELNQKIQSRTVR